jgi:hypothetical protein
MKRCQECGEVFAGNGRHCNDCEAELGIDNRKKTKPWKQASHASQRFEQMQPEKKERTRNAQ